MTTRGPQRALAVMATLAILGTSCGTNQGSESPTGSGTFGPPPSSPASPSASPAETASPCPCESGSASPSAGPDASATVSQAPSITPAPTPRPTPPPTPAPTPAPTPSGWDPNHVTSKLSKIAVVPGRPLAVASAGDGSGRLFVAEQDGRVFVFENGQVLATPFLDKTGQVSGGGEQGLLGLAFHPDFPSDNRVFIYYTEPGGDIVISSFTVDPGADTVVGGSESVILTIEHSTYGNHNGGVRLFGPDGYL